MLEMLEDLLHYAIFYLEEYFSVLLTVALAIVFVSVLLSAIIATPIESSRWALPGDAMEVRIEGEHGELWYHVSNTTFFKTEPVGTIILLHGEGASSNYFAFLFKRLSKRNVRVVAVDMRGHGMSPAAPGICARQMGEDIQAVMDHVGGDKFVLAGFGMGAYAALAWRIFCRKSETNRVSGMVLVNGYSRLPDNWTFVLFQTIASTGLMHLLWRSKSVAKHIGRQWFGRVATPTMLEELRRTLMACPPWMWRQLFKACGQDLTGFLPHIDTPCLLVSGESDIMTYSEQSRLMMLGQKVGAMPDKVSFKDYGHMLAWEATDSLTSLMSRFANSVVCGLAPEGGDGGAGGEVGQVEA